MIVILVVVVIVIVIVIVVVVVDASCLPSAFVDASCTFIVAVAIHAPIGVRTILNEMTNLSPKMTHIVMAVLCLVILVMGFRAIIGLYQAGASL